MKCVMRFLWILGTVWVVTLSNSVFIHDIDNNDYKVDTELMTLRFRNTVPIERSNIFQRSKATDGTTTRR